MRELHYEPDQEEPSFLSLRFALVPLALSRTMPQCCFVEVNAVQLTVCRRLVSNEDACYGCGRPFCEAHRHERSMAALDGDALVTRLLCRDCIELSYGGLEQVRAWRLRLNVAR